MISISDKPPPTCPIGAVGQPALAADVAAMGNAHPTLLDPFLTTKQAFTLDYDAQQVRQQWAAIDPGEVSVSAGALAEPSAATVQARTALLHQLPGGAPTVTTTNPKPGYLDGIEWYASPTDICCAQTTLHQLALNTRRRSSTAIMAKNTQASRSAPAETTSATRAAQTPASSPDRGPAVTHRRRHRLRDAAVRDRPSRNPRRFVVRRRSKRRSNTYPGNDGPPVCGEGSRVAHVTAGRLISVIPEGAGPVKSQLWSC